MQPRSRASGFVLVTMSAGALVMTGVLGMAFDIGRMYIAKSELQTFADAAALAATLRLNGEVTGIMRGENEVTALRTSYKWNLASQQIAPGDVVVDFAESVNNGPPINWSTNPANAANYTYTRVTVHGNMPIYFMAAVHGATHADVGAAATAGQLALPPGAVPQGAFPFTPIAHNDRKELGFGFQTGKLYTLKWSAAPKLTGNNTCQGDRSQALIDVSNKRGSENRGFYGAGANAAVLKDQVANDTPVAYYPEGTDIVFQGGATTTVRDALRERIYQDTDATSQTFSTYRGNGRRLTTVPVTDSANGSRVVGYARFFLLPGNSYNTAQGNEPWCGEFIGIGAPDGGNDKGANTAESITRVRLWH